jgi:hypothetical protein
MILSGFAGKCDLRFATAGMTIAKTGAARNNNQE